MTPAAYRNVFIATGVSGDHQLSTPNESWGNPIHLAVQTVENYYSDKIGSLREICSDPDVRLEAGQLLVGDKRYPIVDDVIILLSPECYPESVTPPMGGRGNAGGTDPALHITGGQGASSRRLCRGFRLAGGAPPSGPLAPFDRQGTPGPVGALPPPQPGTVSGEVPQAEERSRPSLPNLGKIRPPGITPGIPPAW